MARTGDAGDRTLLTQSRALGDPTRHAIFAYVRDAPRPVGVAELTEHFGLNHNAIRQHLAKLRDAALVSEEREHPSGPGRPRLRYRPTPGAIERWGGSGAYEALAMMLLDLVRGGGSPEEVGRRAGYRLAVEYGTESDALEILDAVARRLGFEPRIEDAGAGADVVLERCPFLGPAGVAPDIVCHLHLGIAQGIAEAAADDASVTDLVVRPPARAGCRIKVVPG
ncbi:MAG TPA: helix-turn-helix domain-containing protein [Acidimicrobiales bacterium]